MKLGNFDITPSKDGNYVVKGEYKYIKLGKRELKYLLELNEIVTDEIQLSDASELTDELKKILKEKFEEAGFINGQPLPLNESISRKDISMIHLIDVDPEKFLNKIFPVAKIFFTKEFLILYAIINILTGVVMFKELNMVQQELIQFNFTALEFGIVFIALLFTTALHELGHAIVCRKYGGHVKKMGVCLFFLIPSLYCNVSDIVMFQKKREKVYVALAGVYVNSVLSNLALLIYFFVPNGTLLSSCLFLYYVANVGFIIVNLIPFVKLDGYWLLSAIMDINNLLVKSSILAVSIIFDFKLLKEMGITFRKKAFLIVYGWIVVLFRPFFWYESITELADIFEKIPGYYGRFVLMALVCVVALGDMIRFYFDFIKIYKNERLNIVNFI